MLYNSQGSGLGRREYINGILKCNDFIFVQEHWLLNHQLSTYEKSIENCCCHCVSGMSSKIITHLHTLDILLIGGDFNVDINSTGIYQDKVTSFMQDQDLTRLTHRRTDANLYPPERQLTKASEPSFDLEGGAKGQI